MASERCPRCNGRMVIDRGMDGPIWACLSCGREIPRKVDINGRPLVHQHKALAPQPIATQEREERSPVAELIQTIPAPAPTYGTRTLTSASASWEDLAVKELTGLLAEIAAVDTKWEKAARIHAALTALGLAEVPVLPWRMPSPRSQSTLRGPEGATSAERKAASTSACVICGFTFTQPTQKVNRRDGSVCVSAILCDRRKAEREKAETAA